MRANEAFYYEPDRLAICLANDVMIADSRGKVKGFEISVGNGYNCALSGMCDRK
jgi:hypothetical protein